MLDNTPSEIPEGNAIPFFCAMLGEQAFKMRAVKVVLETREFLRGARIQVLVLAFAAQFSSFAKMTKMWRLNSNQEKIAW